MKKAIEYIKDVLYMPSRIKEVLKYSNSKSINNIGVKVAACEYKIDALLRYITLKESNPKIIEAIMPKISIPPTALNGNAIGRYKKENCIKYLANQHALALLEISTFIVELKAHEALKTFEAALESSSGRDGKSLVLARRIYYSKTVLYDDQLVLDDCRLFEDIATWSMKSPEHIKAWLIYISTLYSTNAKEKGLYLLEKFKDSFGLQKIEEWLPAAAFAREVGISNNLINLAAILYEKLKTKDSYFEKKYLSKSIAVVGNSPVELGKGKGFEIEEHDIVMRFNQLVLSDCYFKDYGFRTDIWVQSTPNIYALPVVANPQMIILAYDPEFAEYPTSKVADLLKVHEQNEVAIGRIKAKYSRELIALMDGHTRPFTGTRALYWLKSLFPDFGGHNIYGFSFKESQDKNMYDWRIPYHYHQSNFAHPYTAEAHFHPIQINDIFLKKIFMEPSRNEM